MFYVFSLLFMFYVTVEKQGVGTNFGWTLLADFQVSKSEFIFHLYNGVVGMA